MFEDQAVTRGKRDEGKERKWREVLGEQRRSKQSVRAFCRERGLKEASFYRWRQVIYRRDRRDAEATGAEALPSRMPALAPVMVIDGPSGDVKSSASVIEIVLDGGATVRVPSSSTSEQLGMVIDVLERSRC